MSSVILMLGFYNSMINASMKPRWVSSMAGVVITMLFTNAFHVGFVLCLFMKCL